MTPLLALIPFFALCAFTTGTGGARFWIGFLLCAIPVWPVVALYSKNLLRDALVYDTLMTATYAATYMAMGWQSLETRHFVGVFVVIAGLGLMR